MKKHLAVAVTIAAATLATSNAQPTASFSAPAVQRTERVQRHTYRPAHTVQIGAFPRAAGGNPLQLVNPLAPARYFGPPQDTVTWDPRNPSRITGLILFGLAW